eukprot:gene5946-4255_t
MKWCGGRVKDGGRGPSLLHPAWGVTQQRVVNQLQLGSAEGSTYCVSTKPDGWTFENLPSSSFPPSLSPCLRASYLAALQAPCVPVVPEWLSKLRRFDFLSGTRHSEGIRGSVFFEGRTSFIYIELRYSHLTD